MEIGKEPPAIKEEPPLPSFILYPDEDPESERDEQEDLRSIELILRGGNLGVAAMDSATDGTLFYNADWTFPTASVIKAPIVAELYARVVEGKLSLDDTVTVEAEDLVGGSGILAKINPGHTFTLEELAVFAIKISDNTASNAVLRAVGGPDAVNRRMHDEWGMTATTIHRPIKFNAEPHEPPHTATGTPRDMMHFMNAVATGTLHSLEVCDLVQNVLKTVEDSAMLSRYLEVNPYAGEYDLGRPKFTVLHKPGAVHGVRNDAGIIRRDTPPYTHVSICVYTKAVDDPRWTVANHGCEAVSRVAKYIANRFLM